jgi:hypothetical protein
VNKRFLRGQWLAVPILLAVLLGAAVPAGLADTPSAAWQTEVVDPDGCWYLSMALDGTGLPRIAYGARGAMDYAWNDGSTWHLDIVEDQPGATGWHPSLKLDSLHNPHISYYSPYSETLMYAEYSGASWHIQTVGSPYSLSGQTSLDLDSSGLPHVIYWDRTHLTVNYARYTGTTWQFDTIATMTDAGGQDVSLALALDSADHPRLCYYDADTDMLKYAYHNGSTWQFETVDNVFYNGQDCSIALDSQDHPHISYRDLGLLYATRDGSTWRITTIDDDFFAGDDSSLALDKWGRPHISYSDWDYPDEELRYAYFTGLHWWIEIVDTAAETRRFEDSSLALDTAGRPHIGYWDLGTSDVLKYAVRGAAPTANRVYLPLVLRQP